MQALFFLQGFNQTDFFISVKNCRYVKLPSKKLLLKASTLRNGLTQENNCLCAVSVIALGVEALHNVGFALYMHRMQLTGNYQQPQLKFAAEKIIHRKMYELSHGFSSIKATDCFLK